ncbi:MAG: MaoC family dehydratase [Pseudomonadota bacterium]|jgi:acyl dehydratase|nr:MaoC family dehydratase [Pseudomonadota bacterium]
MKLVIPVEKLNDYIGKEIGHSDWFLVDQERINQFSDVTIDHQFIHIDEEKSKKGPFGSTIAHGFLTLSLLTHLTDTCRLIPEGTVMGINYGFDKVRFINPVKVNSRIRATVKPLSAVERNPGQWLLKSEVNVEIENEEKPALVSEWLSLVFVN